MARLIKILSRHQCRTYAELVAVAAAITILMAVKRGAAMSKNKTLVGLLVLAAFAMSGCTQWKKLTGTEDKPKAADVVNVNGVWLGYIELDGRSQPMFLSLAQNGAAIVGGSVTIDYSGTLGASVTGGVSGNILTVSGTEQFQCPHPITVSGEVRGAQIVATVATAGNDVPGTDCYPRAINQTVAFGR
jgi:hypothetical protein